MQNRLNITIIVQNPILVKKITGFVVFRQPHFVPQKGANPVTIPHFWLFLYQKHGG